MAKAWKNIPIVLLIVVLTLIGVSDISCASLPENNQSEAGIEYEVNETTSFQNGGESQKGSLQNIPPATGTVLGGRLSKKHLITMSLAGVAVVLISLLAVNRVNNSPAKYDIEKEAKQVSLALESSSASTQEELDRITKALCTNLSASGTQPPFNMSTLFSNFTGPAEGNGNTTEMGAPEATTTAQFRTVGPGPICATPAEKIYGYIKNFIGKLKDGFVVFDMFSDEEKNHIKTQLNETAGTDCRSGFFQVGEVNDHEGLSFDVTNEFVDSAMNGDVCKMAADRIIPALTDLGYTNDTCTDSACTVQFKTDERKTNFLEGAQFVRNRNCGKGFFQITGRNSENIQYQSSNTYIAEAWPESINDQNCQERASGVITLLSLRGHSIAVRSITKTAWATTYDLDSLKAAYARGDGCSCGEGELSMTENSDNLVFKYHNTNPFIEKAWKVSRQGRNCINTGKNVMSYLLELGLYSTDDDASIIVPEWGNNIPILAQKLSVAEGCNCKEGFFKLISEDGYYRLKYNKNNLYIKGEWDKITDDEMCGIASKGIFAVLKGYKKTMTLGRNVVSLPARPAALDELNRKFDIIKGINCGAGFFRTTDGPNYIGITYHSNNPHIPTSWAGV